MDEENQNRDSLGESNEISPSDSGQFSIDSTSGGDESGDKNATDEDFNRSTEEPDNSSAQPTIHAEIEPDTVPGGTPSEFANDTMQARTEVTVDSQAQNSIASSDNEPAQTANPRNRSSILSSVTTSQKRLIVMFVASIVLFAIVGILGWYAIAKLGSETPKEVSDSLQTHETIDTIGATFSVIDGVVEMSNNGDDWLEVSAETSLREGDYVRTNNDSRAVITLDDGSAIRLDGDTTIILKSLKSNDIKIEQVNGALYSRIVPSDRNFEVISDDISYQALGTAFLTIRGDSINGVQVFQSSVKTNDMSDTVSEGKQYFKKNPDASRAGVITDINLDELTGNPFIHWNIVKDGEDKDFKDKLGILERVKERIEDQSINQRQTEEEVDKKIENRSEEENKDKDKTKDDSGKRRTFRNKKVERGAMTLSLDDNKLAWNYTGEAAFGYKLVYSKSNSTPTLDSDESMYFESSKFSPFALSKLSKLGKGKYYVRICAYTANTEPEACVDYSNIVILNL